ncbi:class I SAM-dependent methyltransferase [Aureimonas leprariae]|uniref:Methyltransferase domain-containing protein n=1 Tax=Plantimonas leprariae TaxID=2615207 RepID=A0A7V7PTF9_9HYPH|nr:methyltransferase domain-containing protein [Aureimonas leprariae]KAB0682923.1 methyltransferase domain-containing protein [Aureimonas leprariae]
MHGRDERAGENRGDALRFFKTWLRHPLKLGAVAPSSAAYCATMANCASTEIDGPVLELGPGLGVVTKALLDKGVDPKRITSIEYDPGFAATLKDRFPAVNVIRGDAFDLDRTLGERRGEKFAAILLAVPIVGLPQDKRQALFADYFRRLLPGGNITQLSYLVTAPVKPVPGVFDVSASPVVWDNIPPARVWIYAPAKSGRMAA